MSDIETAIRNLALSDEVTGGDHAGPVEDVHRSFQEVLRRADVLARALLKLAPVWEAACAWRYGMVEVTPGNYIDADDGSAEPGMMRKPARNALIEAVDHARTGGDE